MEAANLCLGCMEINSSNVCCSHCGYQQGSGPESSHHLQPGTVLINKYLIGRVLGQGGFGITYLAWDTTLELKLAIKEFFPMGLVARSAGSSQIDIYVGEQKEQFTFGIDRFLGEAKTLARFSEHPNIVTVRDFFPLNNTAYMVMNYIEGQTFEQYLKLFGGKISFSRAVEIVMPVMDALREVHQTGFMHRDVSPDNIFIRNDGMVALIDFGAARLELQHKSRSMSVIMKVGYSPEEQYRARGKQGPWTDIYALAATIYRGITGETPPESMDRLAEDTLLLPSACGVEITETQEQTLMKAMEIRAKDRYQTVKEFQEALTSEDASISSVADHSTAETDIAKAAIIAAAPLVAEEAKVASQIEQPVIQNGIIKTLNRNRKFIIGIAAGILILIATLAYPMLSNPSVTELKLNHNRLELVTDDDAINLEVMIEPKRAANAELIWSSSDESVVLVNYTGAVKAIDAGSATIRVEATGSGKSAECEVIVDYATGSFSYLVSLIDPDDPENNYITEGLYEGQIKDGLPHGAGIWNGDDGSIYDGAWLQGKWHGEGVRSWPDGGQYVGSFKDGNRHGQGSHTTADGDKYVGEFKDNLYHGQGEYTFAEGGKYVGERKDGQMDGQGAFTYADGSQYVGGFKDNLYHGQGTLTFANGNELVGVFNDGLLHGQGTYTLASGDKYVGEFKYGMRHGQGTYTLASGDKYVGEFKDNLYHGQGTLTSADGRVWAGKWVNNEYVGQ